MLDLMKQLLGIDLADTNKDTILNFYINKAKNAIKNYLNINMTTDDETTYQNQIVELALFYYKNKNELGKIQSTQGSRSQTLVDGIPQSIKDTLPLPFIKVLG
ncbi:MAG: hypothetical protein PWQ70_2189 [Clostridiales bacterium]|nr:hypothetical protein [Clostridiales bacterium]